MSAYVSIAADMSGALAAAKASSHRKLLTTFQEIATDSFTKGTYLAFDIVSLTPASGVSLQLQTFIGQRGIDHRATAQSPVVLDPDAGNLTEIQSGIDKQDLSNAIYAGGQGQGDLRHIASFDPVSIALSPWNHQEEWVDVRNTADPSSV